MTCATEISLENLLKANSKTSLSLVYNLEKSWFLIGYLDKNILNYSSIKLTDLVLFKGKTTFVYQAKEVYKLLENTLEAPIFLDLKLASYIQNSNLGFSWDDLPIRYDLESPIADNFELNKLWQTAKLGDYFITNLDSKLLELWQNLESPLTRVLAVMEQTGIYIDKDKLQEISDELAKESTDLKQEIQTILNNPGLNLNSPTQLGPALVAFGLSIKPKSSGKIPTDKDTLESLIALDESGVVAKILDYRTVTKLNSTFASSFLEKLDDGSRLHGIFSQTAAATGRISSNSPNLQNIPIRHHKYGPLLRSCIASPTGKQLISADYSQIELRLLAHFCGDETLIQAFLNDEDIHTRTASEIFEIPLSDVTKEQRRVGKTLNFALLYQQGAFATGRQLGISTKEATKIIAKYFEKFVKVRPYLDSSLNFARNYGYVETLFGRRRYFDFINSSDGFLRSGEERAACNAPLQGSNADLLKRAMINLQTRIETQKLPAKIILTVHDELVVEVDTSFGKEMEQIVIAEMELNQPLKVPIKVEAGLGANWSLTK